MTGMKEIVILFDTKKEESFSNSRNSMIAWASYTQNNM